MFYLPKAPPVHALSSLYSNAQKLAYKLVWPIRTNPTITPPTTSCKNICHTYRWDPQYSTARAQDELPAVQDDLVSRPGLV